MTLAALPTLTALPALTVRPNPVEFLLPIFAPDSFTPPIPTLPFCGLGMSSIEGAVGVWLGRCLGSFALLHLKWGRMLFSQGLVMVQLVLAIQVSNTHKGQLHRGY